MTGPHLLLTEAQMADPEFMAQVRVGHYESVLIVEMVLKPTRERCVSLKWRTLEQYDQ